MDTESPPPTVTRAEAAAILGVSVRTIDRHIPPGTPGRTDYKGIPGKVRIERSLLTRFLPTPGGDDVDPG